MISIFSPTLSSNTNVLQKTNLRLNIVSCHDGDTCTGRDSSNKQYKLRLAGIDAPEKHQPPLHFAQMAQQRLMALTRGTCLAELLEKDKYGRHITLLFCDNIFVNKKLLSEGLAYAYIHLNYPKSNFIWSERAERVARLQRRGLFASPKTLISPHRFRRKTKT